MTSKLTKRAKNSFLLSLLLLFTVNYSLLAISATQVPGNLKDINTTSKAWLSSNVFPLTFYTKDSNLSLSKKATFKVLTNGNEVALLVSFETPLVLTKDKNSSFEFASSFFDHNITDIGTFPSTHLNFKKSHTISNLVKSIYNDGNETIIGENSTVTIDKAVRLGYLEADGIKTPFVLDENKTLNIDMFENSIYIVKNIDVNQIFENISFAIDLFDGNNTLLYKTKWIKVNLSSTGENDTSSGDSAFYNLQNGKNIFIQNCIACHRYNDDTTAPEGVAPMLTNVGGWANKEYITDSLLHPQKYESPKYKKLIKSGKIMPMPSFDWLDENDFNDLVYFLQNLKTNDISKP